MDANPAAALVGVIFLLIMNVRPGAADCGLLGIGPRTSLGDRPALAPILAAISAGPAWPTTEPDDRPTAPLSVWREPEPDDDGVPVVPAHQQISVAELLERERGGGPKYPGPPFGHRHSS